MSVASGKFIEVEPTMGGVGSDKTEFLIPSALATVTNFKAINSNMADVGEIGIRIGGVNYKMLAFLDA